MDTIILQLTIGEAKANRAYPQKNGKNFEPVLLHKLTDEEKKVWSDFVTLIKSKTV